MKEFYIRVKSATECIENYGSRSFKPGSETVLRGDKIVRFWQSTNDVVTINVDGMVGGLYLWMQKEELEALLAKGFAKKSGSPFIN